MVCKRCLDRCDNMLPHIHLTNKMVLGEEEINYYFFLLEKLEKLNGMSSLLLLPRVKRHFNFVHFPKVTNFVCRFCRKRFHYHIFRYMKAQMYSSIMNVFSEYQNILCNQRKEELKSHLERISKFVKCKDWKGIMYYWYMIYGVPYPLRNVVSSRDYKERKKMDLGGEIFNHQLSHENRNFECLEYILEFYS